METLILVDEAAYGKVKKRNDRGVIAGIDSESLREMSEKLNLDLNCKKIA